jgi:olefin beta-lactone synthetase
MVNTVGVTPALPTAATFERWGIHPTWSRRVSVPSHDGSTYTWHVLDAAPADPIGTIVCIHGNPTWSYLWRSFLARFGERYRVIAVDQLGMGYSDRTAPRRYATRVQDISDVLAALDASGPIILAAHDWGGAIAMGWAVANPSRVRAMVLTNTGIAVPAGTRGPALIRFAAATGVIDLACRRTPIFVAGTALLSGRLMTKTAREAYLAPYRGASTRTAIKSFVADVPFSPKDPSFTALDEVASKLHTLDVPVLLAWGGRDPVFSDAFADDLAQRFRHVDRHRFAKAGHLVVEEADVVTVVDTWLADLGRAAVSPTAEQADMARRQLWAALESRAEDASLAFLDGATGTSTSWADLHQRVKRIAVGLRATGLEPGDRVALLIPPGPDLVAVLYGCWRAGLVTVMADKGLGLRGLGRAIRGARPAWIIGPSKALAAARTMRWAPAAQAIQLGGRALPGLSVHSTLDQVAARGTAAAPSPPAATDPAAVLFTSGATGPAKGVRYTHGQLEEQRDALVRTYNITNDDRLVAAFAPFALYGPALGIPSAIPDVDVTEPAALTASALNDACTAVNATLAFASPSALANVVATATTSFLGLARLRLVLSAGAPVQPELLRSVARLCPAAELHTPYGMTEALPVADIDLVTINATGPGRGVNVGHPVQGAQVRIDPLSDTMGRVLVSAPWLSDGYDGLWATQAAARSVDGDSVWHDSGDVGHLAADGSLWIEGRGVHVVSTVNGLLTPVPIEIEAETVQSIGRAAAVGVGPNGVQQLVVVVEGDHDGLVPPSLADAVRQAVTAPVAAVLSRKKLPVDIRHNAKIDRAALAAWAAEVLDGKRART